ncbi:hypothetical protein L9F63_018999, partial [Diploptera punctata]
YMLWICSELLEAVAIIPQMYYVSKAGTSEKIVDYYIYGLAQYKVLYVLSWVYGYYIEEYYMDIYSVIPGIIQCLIYFYYFFTKFDSKMQRIYHLQIPAKRIISQKKKCNLH